MTHTAGKQRRDRRRREHRFERYLSASRAEDLEGALEHVRSAHEKRRAVGIDQCRQLGKGNVLGQEDPKVCELRTTDSRLTACDQNWNCADAGLLAKLGSMPTSVIRSIARHTRSKTISCGVWADRSFQQPMMRSSMGIPPPRASSRRPTHASAAVMAPPEVPLRPTIGIGAARHSPARCRGPPRRMRTDYHPPGRRSRCAFRSWSFPISALRSVRQCRRSTDRRMRRAPRVVSRGPCRAAPTRWSSAAQSRVPAAARPGSSAPRRQRQSGLPTSVRRAPDRMC